MKEIECRTTAEAERAIAAGNIPVLIGDLFLSVSASVKIVTKEGKPHVVAWESSQPHVEARESSQPHVVARGSSHPHVVARESSQPHVEAWESSQPHVVAWGSSQPHVEAWESSQPHVVAKGCVQLHVSGAVSVVAAASVAILISGGAPTIEGGGFVQRIDISTPQRWCDHYGVEVVDGIALLGKAVRDDYQSSWHAPDGSHVAYVVGGTAQAKDWDGGVQECGGGLHLSPTPSAAKDFCADAKHALICPVKLTDIAVHQDGDYPQKVKVPGVSEPLWEVDWRTGQPIDDRSCAIRTEFYSRHSRVAESKKSEAKKRRPRGGERR